jgi:hypothetical protein
MTISAAIISTDGEVELIELAPGYKQIQKVVGGTFDVVASRSGETSFWIHDEGKLIGLEVNTVATKLLWELNPAFRNRDVLVGTVLVTGGADDEGETLGLSEEFKLAVYKSALRDKLSS